MLLALPTKKAVDRRILLFKAVVSGEESGTINFSVEKQGTIIGTFATSNNSISENFEGYVSFDGKFDINTRNKYYFSGFLDNVKPINGQWKRYSDLGEKNGTFILTKN